MPNLDGQRLSDGLAGGRSGSRPSQRRVGAAAPPGEVHPRPGWRPRPGLASNNRACLALDAGRDPAAALVPVEQAVALRPDVPAVQHTRAAALVAIGRFDEAIGILEAMRIGGELSPALEAVRCRELTKAWEHKGQPDYAADYRERARLVGVR